MFLTPRIEFQYKRTYQTCHYQRARDRQVLPLAKEDFFLEFFFFNVVNLEILGLLKLRKRVLKISLFLVKICVCHKKAGD